MKQLLCFVLTALLLCGCGSPALREGYYLLPLEESEGAPFYFCLEPGGTGSLHAMGQDIPISRTETGMEKDFADCVPTPEGMEFPGEDGPMVLTYSRSLPEEYTNVVLKPGFYVPREEQLVQTLTYVELRPDGTGVFSILGMEKEVDWTPACFYFGDMIIVATAEGFVARDTVTAHYTYTGDSLPDGYLPAE